MLLQLIVSLVLVVLSQFPLFSLLPRDFSSVDNRTAHRSKEVFSSYLFLKLDLSDLML